VLAAVLKLLRHERQLLAASIFVERSENLFFASHFDDVANPQHRDIRVNCPSTHRAN
jgi:hypothetical protein